MKPLPKKLNTWKSGRAKPDGGLVPAVLTYLATQQDVWAWRANSGSIVIPATETARRRVISGAPAGTPDILGYLRLQMWCAVAIPFAVECKAVDGKLSLSQRRWKAKAEQFGVAFIEARSIGDVRDGLRALRGGFVVKGES